MFRNYGFLFWTFAYPIIMALFYYLAFSGMMNISVDSIPVGINSDNEILFILEEIDFLDIHLIDDNEYVEKLQREEIYGYIDQEMNLIVSKTGIKQTIIKGVLEQIKQTFKLNRPIDGSEFSVNYVDSKSQEANSIIIVFYTLIAMVSTYGVFAGIDTVSLIQANLSYVGVRLNATPLRKENFLIAGTIVAVLLNLLANGLLIIFVEYVLKIDIFREIFYTALLLILGNLFGVALGIFIGSSNRKSSNVKTVIGLLVTLLLSFLSGMIGPKIKILIDQYMPILGRLNPIALISNNLYRLNLLGYTEGITKGIALLSYSVILLLLSYVFLRGKSYDGI